MWTLIRTPRVSWACVGVILASAGCHHFQHDTSNPIGHLGNSNANLVLGRPSDQPEIPRENRKVTLAEYTILPPDVLIINIIRAVPLPPYRIKSQDMIFVAVKGTPPEDPIKGVYRVEAEGVIRLGPGYGSVYVSELTIDEANAAIAKHLKDTGLLNPQVSVSLEETRGMQLIKGEHLVRPDGTVNLGIYGRVHVAGLTQDAAKQAIETHLSKHFLNPSILLDVSGFNSSVYYIIFDGAGFGEQVTRLPYTGNETVLDAIGQVAGLPAVASKGRVWIARPEEGKPNGEILPIDWNSITKKGRPESNYQLLPGDRIYVAAIPLVAFDNFLDRLAAPFERIVGTMTLGTSAIRSIRSVGVPLNGGNNNTNIIR